MKKKDILEELEKISELMTNNTVEAWNSEEEIQKTVVVVEDFETGDRGNVEYNGWSNRLENLIKSVQENLQTRMSVMIDNFSHFTGGDDANRENIEKLIETLKGVEDKTDMVDNFIDEDVNGLKIHLSDAHTNTFSVEQFLDQIDTYGYQ